uniref:substrate binding domain-containing protein n=1 Tax=Anaplasma marginale TaxID=770 RepID=UPI0005B47E16
LLTDSYLDLIEDRIDLAVRLGSLQDSSYIVRKLRQMEFYVCASPNYLKKYGFPKSPLQIKDRNCLLFPRRERNLNWFFKERSGKVIEIPISGRYLLTNSLAIKQCAISGMGLTLLPDWLVNEDIKLGNLVRLFPDYDVTATDYQGGIWLLYPSRDYIPLKTQVLINY